MKYLIATLFALFLVCVWATPAKADNCAGSFQLVPVQQQFFVPTNNVFLSQRAFVPARAVIQQRAFVPVQRVAVVDAFAVNRQFGLINVNRGFAPGRAFAVGGGFSRNVQFGLINVGR